MGRADGAELGRRQGTWSDTGRLATEPRAAEDPAEDSASNETDLAGGEVDLVHRVRCALTVMDERSTRGHPSNASCMINCVESLSILPLSTAPPSRC